MSNLLPLLAAGAIGWVVLKPKRRKLSPFVDGCTRVASSAQLQLWMEKRGFPMAMSVFGDERISDQATAVDQMDKAIRAAIDRDACPDTSPDAYTKVYRGVWCGIAYVLADAGLIDEEPEDIISACIDPSFEPPRPTG